MADKLLLEILKSSVENWNNWREEHKDVLNLDLQGANLRHTDLRGANLENAFFSGALLGDTNLEGANLAGADLYMTNLVNANLKGAILVKANLEQDILEGANLREANLEGAFLQEANLRHANLEKANLKGAALWGADLYRADLKGANLTGADLSCSSLIQTNLSGATITGCQVYGISAWDVKFDNTTIQGDLIISQYLSAAIMVDNIEVAQFVYLLINNKKIRDVIKTVANKAVLILGRFCEHRLSVLKAISEALKNSGLVPIIFDFDKPEQRDFSETIMTLAGMCRFIIADITNPKSSPLELNHLVPNYGIPFVPIIEKGEKPFSMFADLQNKYHWVLNVKQYRDINVLLSSMDEHIIKPAERKRKQLFKEKNKPPRVDILPG